VAQVEIAAHANPDILHLSHQIVQSLLQSSDENAQPSIESSRANEDRIQPQSLLLPPIVVLAHPWTTLASDEVVSHLLSLYFTWEQPCLQFIEKDAFLADMKAGNSSQSARPDGFCSSLLVSTLLAQACVS
jgi:hypothetical protein